MKNEKMICYICKKPIEHLAVCDCFHVHICEEENEYECSSCWSNRKNIELEKERYARQILERVLVGINK